jgi:hypothetical protein
MLSDHLTRFADDYRGGLTNHLPMCVVALAHLGATDERIKAFTASYAARLDPAVPNPELEVERAALHRMGQNAWLTSHIESLGSNVAGAAFHGLIRCAYAVMSAAPEQELPHAVAYLHRTATSFGPVPDGTVSDVARLTQRLRDEGLPKPEGRSLTARFRACASDVRFQRIVQDARVDASTLEQLSLSGAHAYLAMDDFASLHVLTAAHAARRLRPWTLTPKAMDQGLLVAALAAYVSAGCPARTSGTDGTILPWPEIRELAITSDDDHVAKLVFSCEEEAAAYGHSIYQVIASKVALRGSS